MGRHVYIEDLCPTFTAWTNSKPDENFTQAPCLYCTVQSTENYFNKSAHFNTIITTYHL